MQRQLYSDPNNYINVLAKLYAGLAISGNNGPAGQPDLGGIDEGFSQYVRRAVELTRIANRMRRFVAGQIPVSQS